MRILPIDQMSHLSQRLGKAKVDRIRYARLGKHRRMPGGTNIENTLLLPMQGKEPGDPGCPISDILSGAAKSAEIGRPPLSVQRLYNVFQCMKIINTREIQTMMAIDARQARRYMQAVKAAKPFLERELLKEQPNDCAMCEPPL